MDELYEAVDGTLSAEFKERFNPSTLALSIALLVCLVGGLAALIIMMAAEVRVERERGNILSVEDMALLRSTVRVFLCRLLTESSGFYLQCCESPLQV